MVKKPTIAFIIHSLSSGGAERVVSTLSNELVEKYRVIIVTFVGDQSFYELDERIERVSCFQSIAPSKSILDAAKTNYGLYKRISNILKSNDVDLAIGFMTNANVLAILASKFNKIPIIISERNNPYATNVPFIWRKLRRLTYPSTNYLVLQTEGIKKFFTPWMPESKLVILPNPLSPLLSQHKNRNFYKQNIVLNVGSLTDQKGQDVLIKAFSRIVYSDWKLIIIGEGENKSKYQDLINRLDMGNSVFLIGRQSDIAKYYNMAKIFAFSSRFEGFPNALIEAMFMGLPCISTNCPTGPSELIQNGENGFLIEIDDQTQLEVKLKELMEDSELRERFSKQGQSVTRRFEVENVVNDWDKIISSCII